MQKQIKEESFQEVPGGSLRNLLLSKVLKLQVFGI